MHVAWQRSSVVEQKNHNLLVGGPNPSAATRIQTARVAVFYCFFICIMTWVPWSSHGMT